jgi:hypothetical protein
MVAMADPDINSLREKARAKMTDGKLPRTIEAVARVVADPRTLPNGACAVCDVGISKNEFWYQVHQSDITPTAIQRPMHFLCHAAWQLEVRGMPRS